MLFVVVRSSARESGVYDQSRYWVDVRYLSSSDILDGVFHQKAKAPVGISGYLERGSGGIA